MREAFHEDLQEVQKEQGHEPHRGVAEAPGARRLPPGIDHGLVLGVAAQGGVEAKVGDGE